MKKRDDVRHLLRRQDKTRHITVIDLKTLQERWLQSVDRILPVETSKRRCEPVGARIGFADGVTTRASPLRQVAASRHLFRAPGRREGNAPHQPQADCTGFLTTAGSPITAKISENAPLCCYSLQLEAGVASSSPP